MSNKQSSVQWLTMTLSHLEVLRYHGGMEAYDYLEAKTNAMIQAKEMHKEEHSKTWDDSIDNYLERGKNVVRHWSDFDEYYNDKYK